MLRESAEMIIATICARGGSKGLPRKNVLSFCGKPLIAYTIEQALACEQISAVYVSTDDAEIAEVARHYGARVPYMRPADLASDTAAKLPAIEHLLKHIEQQGVCPETVVDLQPTSPLRIAQDICGAIALTALAGLVVSVSSPSHNPYYTLVEPNRDGTLMLSKPNTFVRRQDIPDVFGLTGSIYVWQRSALSKAVRDGFWSVPVRPFYMPRERSIDIDDVLDFEIAEWLYRKNFLT